MCLTVSYCVLLCLTVSYCVLLCLNVSYCVLLCLNVSYCVLMCLTVSYCVLLCLTVLPCDSAYNGTISHSPSTGQRNSATPASNPDVIAALNQGREMSDKTRNEWQKRWLLSPYIGYTHPTYWVRNLYTIYILLILTYSPHVSLVV
jgi:hypothetical protein